MLYIIQDSLVDYNEKSNTIITTGQVYNSDHRAELISLGFREVTDTEFSIIKRKSQAWNSANALGEQLDNNARVSMLYLLMDPNCPIWRKDRILAVQGWWVFLWNEYARVVSLITDEERGLIEGNTEFDPAIVGNCPYTIWQITNE